MTTVSIVIPCYRYGRFLRQCVESVLSQQGVDVQILIIDDASPDDSAGIARLLASENPRVAFRAHGVNVGHIRTYNEGIDWSTGEFFLLLSADDYLLPGALKRGTDLLVRHPNMVFVFGRVIELYGQTCIENESQLGNLTLGAHDTKLLNGSEFIRLSGARNIVPTPAAIVRTAIQKKCGGYRPELPHAGDMEMWLRLATMGDVGVVGDYQAIYRRHDENMSRGFADRHWLPDLQQRKLAMDIFFSGSARNLLDAEDLRLVMLRKLSREAVGCASGAFNDHDFALCRQILEFASDVDPRVRESAEWRKLALKQRMGARAWSAFRPVYGYSKRIMGTLRRMTSVK